MTEDFGSEDIYFSIETMKQFYDSHNNNNDNNIIYDNLRLGIIQF